MDYVLLVCLWFTHCLADFPLQGEYLSTWKNPMRFPKRKGEAPWWYVMFVHSSIHGGFVGMLTGIWWLGLCEAVAHFAIDTCRCKGYFGFMTDQVLHVLCKVLWVAMVVYYVDVQPYEALLHPR